MKIHELFEDVIPFISKNKSADSENGRTAKILMFPTSQRQTQKIKSNIQKVKSADHEWEKEVKKAEELKKSIEYKVKELKAERNNKTLEYRMMLAPIFKYFRKDVDFFNVIKWNLDSPETVQARILLREFMKKYHEDIFIILRNNWLEFVKIRNELNNIAKEYKDIMNFTRIERNFYEDLQETHYILKFLQKFINVNYGTWYEIPYSSGS